jgi:hypothetical protein
MRQIFDEHLTFVGDVHFIIISIFCEMVVSNNWRIVTKRVEILLIFGLKKNTLRTLFFEDALC